MATRPIPMPDAIGRLRPDDDIGFGLGPGQPSGFLHALAGRDDWDGLRLAGALLVDFYEIFTRPNVTLLSGFFGPIERILYDTGNDVRFVPSDFRRFGPILRESEPHVMATVATPPDADGFCSLSVHAGATVDELHRAGADPERLLVVEVNPNFPRTFGLEPNHPHRIHLDEIDLLVESTRDPFNLADLPASEVEIEIARLARAFIDDGCTIQTGIGGIPSTIVAELADEDGGDYGIHSEMFTTGLMRLHQAGKVTNRKGVYDGYSVTTFAAGTPELYSWLDGNAEVRFLPVEYVNSPEIIARNRKMVTINGALTVDLYGQVVADTIGPKQYSGIGGHEDFVSATGLEPDDRSLVCLPSTATVDGTPVSRIVPALPGGWIVTTPRHQLDVVITEYGTASLRGRTVRERALALAGIAHPTFRDELLAAAEQIR